MSRKNRLEDITKPFLNSGTTAKNFAKNLDISYGRVCEIIQRFTNGTKHYNRFL